MTIPSQGVPELHEKIDRLLHDAEHAKSGAMMAGMMIGKIPSAFEDRRALLAKAANLIAEAEALDPKRTAPAWSEADV